MMSATKRSASAVISPLRLSTTERGATRQQLTTFNVVPTAACDRRLDGSDQKLGRRPSVTRRLHCGV